MTANPSGPDSARTVVRAELESGAEVLGEWSGGSGPLGAVILLHDLDLDLDSMRSLARSLASAGLAVLNVDLPGHGISAGSYWDDGVAAVEAAAAFCAERRSGRIAFVAHGHTCGLLAGADVRPIARVLVDPLPDDRAPTRLDCWTSVPTVVIQDPLDPVASAEVDRIIGEAHAWNLRVHLHPSRDEADGRSGSDRPATPQVVGMASKFLLEQLTYATAREAPESWKSADGGVDASR
jgi:Alpha/beta hydrolase family